MKKKLFSSVCVVLVLSFLLLTGCGEGNKADADAGEQIKALKSNNPEAFTSLLDEGIDDVKEFYALDFPEELKKPYLEFLQDAFSYVKFEADAAKEKSDNTYSILVKFKPVDIAESTAAVNEEYQNALKSSDLTAETTALLKKDMDVFKDNVQYEKETNVTLTLEKKEEKFVITEKSLNDLIASALYGCMAPYESVCDILNTQDYMTAYLDANFGKDFNRYIKHTGMSQEEVQAWYDSANSLAPDDFPQDLTPRLLAAMEGIYKQCKYTVGIPKKAALDRYTIDVTFTPNNSLTEAYAAFSGGTYYSEREVYEALVSTLEAYAGAPVYGTESTMNINLDYNALLNADKEGTELSNLGLAICPVPDITE